jgi:hypothetical protein
MKNIFTKHPHSIGETYFQHLKFALSFGWNMVLGGSACIIHAIFPFFFQNTGSDKLFNLTKFFIERMPPTEERIQTFISLIEKKQADSQRYQES